MTTGTVASSHTNIDNTTTNITSPLQQLSESTSTLINEVLIINNTPDKPPSATISLPYTNEEVPIYKMSRQVATVPGL